MKKQIKIAVVGTFWSGALACQTTSHYSSVTDAAANGRCEEALAALDATNGKHDQQVAAGETAKVGVVETAAIAADTTIMIAGGVIVGAIFCPPSFAVSLVARNDAKGPVDACFRGFMWGAKVSDPHLSEPENSSWLSERDFSALGQAMRSVAACYAERGDSASLVKAYTQLKNLSTSPIFEQMSDEERRQTYDEIARDEASLAKIDPQYMEDVKAKQQSIDAAVHEAAGLH